MVYIQGLAQQTRIFMYSLGFGFLLGILYDIFRTLRLIISRSRGFVFFADILYFVLCAFLTFCFMLVADSGRVRLYVGGGEVLGWLIYYFSFGAIAIKTCNALVAFVHKAFSLFLKPIKRFFGAMKKKSAKMSASGKKIIRKSDKKAKFILQKHRGIVYNLNSYMKNSVLRNKGSSKNDRN